jgi:hypothetical protein
MNPLRMDIKVYPLIGELIQRERKVFSGYLKKLQVVKKFDGFGAVLKFHAKPHECLGV